MVEFEHANFNDLLEEPSNENNEVEEVVDEEPLLPDQESDGITQEPESTEQPTSEQEAQTDEGDDVLTSYLKSRGISDPTKIQFENDEGGLDEVDFNSLSKEEQLTILNELSSDYTDYERDVINFIRRNGGDLNTIVQQYQQKAIEDYLSANPEAVHQKSYTIDDYSDDELYLADLAAKFPDFTEDELTAKLDSAKINEDLFKKEVDALRTFYKNEEDRQAEESKLQNQQEYEALQNALLDAANNFNEIALDSTDPQSISFEVEDADKQKMLTYLLAQDKDGMSQLSRDLLDPSALIELAWLRTHGRDALDEVSHYWKKELAETRKKLSKAEKELEKYTKKKDDNVYVAPSKPTQNKPNSILDVWDNYK